LAPRARSVARSDLDLAPRAKSVAENPPGLLPERNLSPDPSSTLLPEPNPSPDPSSTLLPEQDLPKEMRRACSRSVNKLPVGETHRLASAHGRHLDRERRDRIPRRPPGALAVRPGPAQE